MAEILAPLIDTGKLSRRSYLDELAHSRIAISPFGLGEITLRDFEIFMSGALLLKPDMTDIETWPDFFRDGETMAGHRWDFSDLQEKIETLLVDPALAIELATEGQHAYCAHLVGPHAGELFAAHLLRIIAKCETLNPR